MMTAKVIEDEQGQVVYFPEEKDNSKKVSPPVTLFFVLFKKQSSDKDYNAGADGSYDNASDKAFSCDA